MNILRNLFIRDRLPAKAYAKPRVSERQLIRYALVSMAITVLVVLAHQTYQKKEWEQYRIAHGCEPTEFVEDLALGLIKRAWTCDDGQVYYR